MTKVSRIAYRIIVLAVSFCLVFEQTGFAQVAAQSGVPAYLNGQISAERFRPMQLRSLAYDSLQNNFSLYLDKGDIKELAQNQIKENARKLMEYFRVGIVLPNSKFWVNLRPDSADEVIDPDLEKTDLGKVLLEADLQLKKDMANFSSPNTPEGKLYWDKLYQKAQSLFGQQELSVPTLTRPWIVPAEVVIRKTRDSAYIYKATLKVMLEQDYLKDSKQYNFDDPRLKELNDYSSRLMRELVIPKLTREVNSSKRYAGLRQVYYSLTLAQWFKQSFQGQPNEFSRFIDGMDLTGLTSKIPWNKNTYFNAYQKSFAKGEYDKQETRSSPYGMTIRRYFSGGILPLGDSKTVKVEFDGRGALPVNGLFKLEFQDYLEAKGIIVPPSGKQDLGANSKDGGIKKWLDKKVAPANLNTDMFRDYDYRSQINTDEDDKRNIDEQQKITPEVAFRFGIVWARMALEKAKAAGIDLSDPGNRVVLLARDARDIGGKELPDALIGAFKYMGFEVKYAGEVNPNAVTSYSWAVQQFRPLTSVFITASHVEAEENIQVRGFKVAMVDTRGGTVQSLTTQEIKEASRAQMESFLKDPAEFMKEVEALRKDLQLSEGKMDFVDVDENCIRMNTLIGRVAGKNRSIYDLARAFGKRSSDVVSILKEQEDAIESIELDYKPLKGMKLVIEGANTPSGKLALETFARLGAEVELLNPEVVLVKGKHKADPAKSKNLEGLRQAMQSDTTFPDGKKADFGMAFDLDGDRGAIVVPVKGGFETLTPDNLIVALLDDLIGKWGYQQSGKKIAVIRDVLGTYAVNDKTRSLANDQDKKSVITEQTDAGYVFLKAMRRILVKEQPNKDSYVVPIYGERSGHCWLDVTGEIENPVAVAVLFSVMAAQFKNNNPQSAFLFKDVYESRILPYYQAPRFSAKFSEKFLQRLVKDAKLNKDKSGKKIWAAYQRGKKPPQEFIALARNYAIEKLREKFTEGQVFNTPAGQLKVSDFLTVQDSADQRYRFADIHFSLPDGTFAGRFVFRASSNDPLYVLTYESPVLTKETDRGPARKRAMAIGGLVLDWMERNDLAALSRQALILEEMSAKGIITDDDIDSDSLEKLDAILKNVNSNIQKWDIEEPLNDYGAFRDWQRMKIESLAKDPNEEINRRADLQALVDQGKAFNLVEAIKSEADRDKAVNAINGLKIDGQSMKAGDFETAPVDIIKEQAEENGDFSEYALQPIADGKTAVHFNFGGAASRLGLGGMYFVKVKELAKVMLGIESSYYGKKKAREIKEKVTEYFEKNHGKDGFSKFRFMSDLEAAYKKLGEAEEFGMGPAQIISYRLALKNFATDHNLNEEDVIDKNRIIIHVNDEIMQDVANDLYRNNFYGFKAKNVYLLSDTVFHGYKLDADYNLEFDPKSNVLPPGHGYALEQFSRKNQVFIFQGDTLKQVEDPLLKILKEEKVDIIRTQRVNDVSLWTEDVLSPARLGYFIANGAQVGIELVDNPTGQKGGSFVRIIGTARDFLVETLALKTPDLEALVEKSGKENLPYNAFRNIYTIEGLEKILVNKLPRYLKIDKGEVYTETVTGDVTQLKDAGAVAFRITKEEAIHDFKEFKNLPEALEFLGKWQGFVSYTRARHGGNLEVVSLSKDSKVETAKRERVLKDYVEQAKALGLYPVMGVKKAVDKIVNKLNALKIDGKPITAQELEPAPVEIISQLAPQTKAKIRMDAIEAVKKGELAAHFNFGGAASRLGLGAMYFIRIPEILKVISGGHSSTFTQEQEKSILEKVNEMVKDKATKELIGPRVKKTADAKIYLNDEDRDDDIKSMTEELYQKEITQMQKMEEELRQEFKDQLAALGGQMEPFSNIGMGPLQLKMYLLQLKNFARDNHLSEKEVLSSNKIIIHVNDEILQEVADDLVQNDFYGFSKENIFILSDTVFKGYKLNQDYSLASDDKSEALPPGHGYALQQFNHGNQVYVFRNYRLEQIKPTMLAVLDTAGVKYIRTQRVNDVSLWTKDVLSLERLGFFIQEVKNNGVQVGIELVKNPTGQKGGSFLRIIADKARSFLAEGVALNAPWLSALLDLAGEKKSPYNAFRNLYTVKGLEEILSDLDLPQYFKVAKGKLYLEMVTGDVTQLQKAKTVAFQINADEEIHDFKEVRNIVEAAQKLIDWQKTTEQYQDSRILAGQYYDRDLSQQARDSNAQKSLEKYREDTEEISIRRMEFPATEQQKKDYNDGIDGARKKYDQNGNVRPFEGWTVVTPVKDGGNLLPGLFKKLVGDINGSQWGRNGVKVTIATVAEDSAHVTLYDLVCTDNDWLNKYTGQLNRETAASINKLQAELMQQGLAEEEALKQATYQVVSEKVKKVLTGFQAARAPVFKPKQISTFMPGKPGAIVLSLEPATAEDLAIVTRLQDAIEVATGIRNHWTYRAHITLGYLVNSYFDNEVQFNEFKGFLEGLDDHVRSVANDPAYQYVFPHIELSNFKDMESFPATASFNWETGVAANQGNYRKTGDDPGAPSNPMAPGGVDFRAIPVGGQMISPIPLTPRVMQMANSSSIQDLKEEWQDIQGRTMIGPVPYDKLKDYVAACCQRQDTARQIEEIQSWVNNVLSLEEAAAVPTSEELKQVLLALG